MLSCCSSWPPRNEACRRFVRDLNRLFDRKKRRTEVSALFEQARVWERAEAEKRFSEVLDGAKAGRLQRVSDVDGVFEIKFSADSPKEPAGRALARGGPDTK